jgi:hypothetical protein
MDCSSTNAKNQGMAATMKKLAKLRDPEIVRKNIVHLKRELSGIWWDLIRPDSPPPVFLVGCSRSGTTVTFETHWRIEGIAESGFRSSRSSGMSLHGPLN